MTLEASATAYTRSAVDGTAIKTGDATRALVGMARPVAGPLFANTAAQRFVRTWFNDPGIEGRYNLASNAVTSGGPYVDLMAGNHVEALVWAQEVGFASVNGCCFSSTVAVLMYSAIVLDGVFATPEDGSCINNPYAVSTHGAFNCLANFGQGVRSPRG